MTLAARFRIPRGDFVLDASLEVPARGVTGVFGPSGSGKTTLLRAVAGLEHDPDGYCRVGDEVWQDSTGSLATHRRPLGYVFQEASLFGHLNVRRNLEYGLKRVPESRRRVTLEDVATLLGVDGLLDRQPQQLSGGERQRVAIARALLTSPRLLLMDEPLSGLDQTSKREILPYLERLHDELAMPVLYVSHAPEEIARLADHVVLMRDGKVRASGPITELLTRLDLAREQGADADAVIEATVAGFDDAFDLAWLDSPAGRFSVAGINLPIGRRVRIRVLARDVSITLQPQADTSILNIFPAVINELVDESPGQVLLRLDIGGVPVLARITRKSASALMLVPGKRVHAQIKAVALLN